MQQLDTICNIFVQLAPSGISPTRYFDRINRRFTVAYQSSAYIPVPSTKKGVRGASNAFFMDFRERIGNGEKKEPRKTNLEGSSLHILGRLSFTNIGFIYKKQNPIKKPQTPVSRRRRLLLPGSPTNTSRRIANHQSLL